eukprot:m.457456 g.457456  ORF g.457456 m.457456 type:complete len:658 (-) comp21265_c0_seq1:119-2092(-)
MSNAVHAVPELDDAIKEYLLFRGFTNTLRSFDAERRNDGDRGLRVDKIVDQLFSFIEKYEVEALLEFWDQLNWRFFSRLEKPFTSSVRKLEICLKRYYVINAIQTGRPDKVAEFFDKIASEAQAFPEWRDWFALPFVKNPELQPMFETYFTRAWLDTFTLSLHNFLSTMFHNLPLPTLLSFDEEQIKLRAMVDEIESLRAAAWQDSSAGYKGHPPSHQAGSTSVAGGVADGGAPVEADGSGIPPPYTSASAARLPRDANAPTPVFTLSGTEVGSPEPPEAPATQSQPHSADDAGSGDAATGGDAEEEDAEGGDQNYSVQNPSSDAFVVLNQERYTEHNAAILQCAASPTGSYIASVDTDSVLKVWCTSPLIKTKLTRTGQTLPARISAVAWDHQSDTTLYIGFVNGDVLGIDVETEAETGTAKMPDTHPRVVALASQGSMVVCGLASGFDRPTGQLMLLHAKTLSIEAQLPVQSKTSVPCSFNFNHNTTLLVVGCEDGMVQIFDVRSNKFIMGWQAHKQRICGTKFSQDETTVFSSAADGKLMRWNAHHLGAPIAQSPADPVILAYAATYPHASGFSFDVEDEYVLRNCSASDVSAPGEVAIFVLRHSATDPIAPPALRLSGHEAAVTCFTWSSTTNTVISGSADNTVRVYTLFKVT